MSANADPNQKVLEEIVAKVRDGEWSLPDDLMDHIRSRLCSVPTTDAERRERVAHIIDPAFIFDFAEMIDIKGAEDEWQERWARWLERDRWQQNLVKAEIIMASRYISMPPPRSEMLPPETVAWAFIDQHQKCADMHAELTDLVRRARNDVIFSEPPEKPAP